jgi:hypothetical protein
MLIVEDVEGKGHGFGGCCIRTGVLSEWILIPKKLG